MNKIISELWYGNINPVNHFGEDNTEMKKLEILMNKNYEKLAPHLNQKDMKVFSTYIDCVNEYTLVLGEQAFYDGFCLGIQLISAALK